MYFDSFAEFLLMGKHGFYVWMAYGITAAVLLGSWLSARQAFVNAKQQIAREIELADRSASVTNRDREGFDESET
ncbi:MAG: heme exporter protein CcmD [Proteobacteria bacterium]|jgi:heme exporter protein D|nr:heme exporter protein CcmD [Pseudomonadota bacterium]